MTGAPPFRTGDPELDAAIPLALAVCERNLVDDELQAGQRYPRPWLRDAYEGGLVPVAGRGSDAHVPLVARPGRVIEWHPALRAYVDGLARWRARQGGTPVYTWPAGHPHHVAGGERCAPGQVCTNRSSGDHDETLIFVSAVRDAYVLTGDPAWLDWIPWCEAAWQWAAAQVPPGGALIDAQPLVAADWADQIARRGVATNVNALWYDATAALALLCREAGRTGGGERYADRADEIRAAINATLWRESAPRHRNAAPVAPFGHYVAWIDGGEVVDYFELDSNFRCLALGIATPTQAASVMEFVLARPELLGGPQGPPPAKVLYGDYAPAHYASIHDNTGDGRYHNAWWGHVGALAAEGCARYGADDLARSCLRALAAALQRGAADGTGLREWYAADGTGHGSEWFQWSARAYLRACARITAPR